MANSKETIKNEFRNYISRHGYGQYGWYIGIAEDVSDRLFNDHNVEEDGAWIYDLASSAAVAREIEQELIIEFNAKGSVGGGSDETQYVYAYKITSSTRE